MSRRRRSLIALAAALGLGLTTALPGAAAPSAPDGGTFLGVFRELTPYTAVADEFRADTGITPASVQSFEAFALDRPFPTQQARDLWDRGILLHWTWEPWSTALSATDPGQITLQDVLDGDWDSYIRQRGAELAAVGAPVLVRWGHEFNGDWYPWSTVHNGKDPSVYVRAYRHVHDLVTAAGATNVQWVWAFNNSSVPDESWNQPALAYPGDAYVDWVGIDGYNWGRGPSWDPAGDYWTSFDGVIGDAYGTAVRIAPDKPVMVAEIGSTEDGGDKAAWFTAMFDDLDAGRYPNIRLLTYFDMLKEEPWAVASSQAAKNAFVAGAAKPSFQGTGVQLAQVVRGVEPIPDPTDTPTPDPEPTDTATPDPEPTDTATPDPEPTDTTTPDPVGCRAELVVTAQWGTGFTGEVRVTTTTAVTGWTLGFDLPAGSSVQNGWNGSWSQQGTAVTVRDAGWNAAVPAGASVAVGFVGQGTAPAPSVPVTFRGVTCAAA